MTLLEEAHDILQPFLDLFRKHQRDLITILRQPTPVKFTRTVTADANGNIGGGLTNPSPITLFQIPLSAEAWVNRIIVQSPGHGPSAPLTAGEALIQTSMGYLLLFLPVSGAVAPVIMQEGRHSAPHIDAGQFITIVGDGFTAGTVLKLDFQVLLDTGISQYTPSRHETPTVD